MLIVETMLEASFFATHDEAHQAGTKIPDLPMTKGLILQIVDGTIHDAPAPDADNTPIPTRAEVLQAAHDAGNDRRVVHAASRAKFRDAPSALIIPHPGNGGK
jgi:hypothetical protein